MGWEKGRGSGEGGVYIRDYIVSCKSDFLSKCDYGFSQQGGLVLLLH